MAFAQIMVNFFAFFKLYNKVPVRVTRDGQVIHVVLVNQITVHLVYALISVMHPLVMVMGFVIAILRVLV